MPFAWRCRRCKGPPVPGGPDGKPWIGPCPNCGGYYDADRVSVASGEVDGAQVQAIRDGEAISMSDAITQESNDDAPLTVATGSEGFDWVLGGGIPTSIAILLASPPGGGKSTLLIEILRKLAKKGTSVLYCSAEESTKQLARRYARLGRFPARLRIVHETDIDAILELIRRERPTVAAVDSLHELEGVCDDNGQIYSAGSGMSATLAARQIKKLAAEEEITIFAVGHVTKDGNIASSNTVQHALDMTLYLNGEQRLIDGRFVIVGEDRTLRCDGKNRFAPTGRVARFSMTTDGLHDRGPWLDENPPWRKSVAQAEDDVDVAELK